MRQKASFSARGLRRHVIHPKKATRDGDLQDGTVVASPLMSATPSKSTSGSSVTRNDASLHAQSSPIPASMKSGSPEQGSPAQGDLSTTVEPKPPFRPEQLWDQAYDDLKAEEPKLLTQYEMTLSRELEDSSKEATVNVIETNPAKRRSQMDGLLKKGLDKTEKPAQIEQKIGNAIGIVLSVKEAIALGLQAVPIAALAWTGVCFALQASPPPDISSAGSHDFLDRFELCRRVDGESRRNPPCHFQNEMVLQPVDAPPGRYIRASQTLSRPSRPLSKPDTGPV